MMENHQQGQEMDSGEKRLNELGYKQELRREMVHNFCLLFLLISCLNLDCIFNFIPDEMQQVVLIIILVSV